MTGEICRAGSHLTVSNLPTTRRHSGEGVDQEDVQRAEDLVRTTQCRHRFGKRIGPLNRLRGPNPATPGSRPRRPQRAPHTPPANDEDDDYVPFFLTRGRWLRHIGLGKGTNLELEWTGEQLIITSRYSPGFWTLHMPTKLVREVHYTTVQAYAHHPAPKGFEP